MGTTSAIPAGMLRHCLSALALLAVGVTIQPAKAAGVPVDEAGQEQKAQAQEVFAAGDAAFDVQDYATALEHFRRSFDTVASPNSQLMIARSLLELNRLDEAYEEYGQVMAAAEGNDEYAVAYETAKKERAALASRLAWVTIHPGNVPTDAQLEIAGRARTRPVYSEPVPINPGKTLIRATTDDGRVAVIELHLAGGRRREITLQLGKTAVVGTPAGTENGQPLADADQSRDLAPKPFSSSAETGPRLRTWAYVAGGIGVTGMAAFATFGILSGNRYSALDEACSPEGSCPASSQSDIDQGKQFQTLANVGLGVGLTGIGAAVALFLLDNGHKKPVSVDVGAGPEGGRLQLRGEF